MGRRTLVIIGAVILGLGIMIGVVLYLRARAAPEPELPLAPVTSAPHPTTNKKSTNTFTPYSQIPKAAPWKPGDPVPPGAAAQFAQPSFTQPTSTH